MEFLHLDLKMENIMLLSGNKVKLSEFGLYRFKYSIIKKIKIF